MSTLTKRKTVKRRKLIEQKSSDWSLWQELNPVMVITTITLITVMVAIPLVLMSIFKGLVA